MSSKVSQLEKLKLDTAYFDELRRKSEKERVRRQAGAKKLKEEHKQKRLQREQQLKLEQQRREEKQRRQAKVSVEVTLSLKKVIDHLTKVKDLVPLDVIFKQLGCKGSKQKLLELLRKSPYAEVKEGTKPLLVKYKSKYVVRPFYVFPPSSPPSLPCFRSERLKDQKGGEREGQMTEKKKTGRKSADP